MDGGDGQIASRKPDVTPIFPSLNLCWCYCVMQLLSSRRRRAAKATRVRTADRNQQLELIHLAASYPRTRTGTLLSMWLGVC
jgi:hypothetical protein